MNSVEQLHPLEVRVLRVAAGGVPFTAADLMAAAGLNLGQCNQAFSWLEGKGLIAERERVREVRYELTELGEQYRRDGLPEERMVALLRDAGPLPMPEIAARLGLEQRDVGSAYGALAREGVLAMDGGRQVSAGGGDSARVAAIRALLERLAGGASVAAEALTDAERAQAAALSHKRGVARGMFRATESQTVSYVLTAAGRKCSRPSVPPQAVARDIRMEGSDARADRAA